MTWITTTDRDDRRHYVRADGHIIDGHGYGRMKWTVVYPDGTSGMTDTLAEAKAWAGEGRPALALSYRPAAPVRPAMSPMQAANLAALADAIDADDAAAIDATLEAARRDHRHPNGTSAGWTHCTHLTHCPSVCDCPAGACTAAVPVYASRHNGPWVELAHVGVLRDWMEQAGFRHGELVAHIADLDAGHVLTADNGREFRRVPVAPVAPVLPTTESYAVWVRLPGRDDATPYRTDLLRSVAIRWAAEWNAQPDALLLAGATFYVVRVTTSHTVEEA